MQITSSTTTPITVASNALKPGADDRQRVLLGSSGPVQP